MIKEIDKYLNKLFPLNRSISGKGNEKSLDILREVYPFEIKSISSNTQVFDWTVPPEWNVNEAWVKDSKGNLIVNFKDLNLHLVSYSIPVNKKINYDELKSHLHYLEEQPDSVPYRTSYYKRDWGFCISYNKFLNLDEDETYHVFIDSSLDTEGKMVYGEALIKGETDEEILISSYICHPSLANDNLSGVILSCFLFNELSKIDTYYSYRLLLIPETIGAISWLWRNKTNKIKFALVPSCVAGPGKLGFKPTFLGNTSLDKAIEYALNDKDSIKYKFEPIGSDERQYSSPAFKIPTATITKAKYYEYDEYHTSLDNLDYISPSNLKLTLDVYLKAINYLELDRKYKRKFNECEFMLSKLGNIYPDTGGTISQPLAVKNHLNHEYTPNTDGKVLDSISWLSYGCDGDKSLFDIQNESNIPIDDLIYSLNILKSKNLII
jgi:aminopeptidase-like protein